MSGRKLNQPDWLLVRQHTVSLRHTKQRQQRVYAVCINPNRNINKAAAGMQYSKERKRTNNKSPHKSI